MKMRSQYILVETRSTIMNFCLPLNLFVCTVLYNVDSFSMFAMCSSNQMYDVVRYRKHRMKKKLKDELDSRNTIQEYICPTCGRSCGAKMMNIFHCENCNAELVAESDKLAAEEMREGDDNARRRRREKLKDMLQKVEIKDHG